MKIDIYHSLARAGRFRDGTADSGSGAAIVDIMTSCDMIAAARAGKKGMPLLDHFHVMSMGSEVHACLETEIVLDALDMNLVNTMPRMTLPQLEHDIEAIKRDGGSLSASLSRDEHGMYFLHAVKLDNDTFIFQLGGTAYLNGTAYSISITSISQDDGRYRDLIGTARDFMATFRQINQR